MENQTDLTPEEQAVRLEETYEELSALVTKHGPSLLARGMKALDANLAILGCIKVLIVENGILKGNACSKQTTE